MFQRLIEQERAICQVLSMDPKCVYLKPRWQDTEVMECIVTSLSPVSDLTDILSAEERVTTSCLRPLISHLCEMLSCKEGDPDLKVDIQERILEYMKAKYVDMGVRKLINISACLDPRFMLTYSNDEEITFVRLKIVEEGKMIAKRLEETTPESTEPSQQQDSDPPKKKRKLVDILSKVTISRNKTLNNKERVNDELTRYLQCPQPEMKSNPLQWWKCHQNNFPILSHLARKYLSICATKGYSVLVAISSLQNVHALSRIKLTNWYF